MVGYKALDSVRHAQIMSARASVIKDDRGMSGIVILFHSHDLDIRDLIRSGVSEAVDVNGSSISVRGVIVAPARFGVRMCTNV